MYTCNWILEYRLQPIPFHFNHLTTRSQSHVITDGQSANQSWCQPQDQIFVTVTYGFFDVGRAL
jgi:hypothetical protein